MVRGWRWERVLLVVVLALGVLAMHAVPALGAGQVADPMTGSSAMSGPAGSAVIADPPGPDRPGDDQPGHGSNSALHHVLAVCLAILGAAALLVAAAAVSVALRAQVGDAVLTTTVATVVAVAPRPPPAHAVRLAQLCVLRN